MKIKSIINIYMESFIGITDFKLTQILNDILEIEKHHVKKIEKNEMNKITNVTWSPKFICYDMYCEGKRKIKHHECRICRRIVLHLLGDIGSHLRWCLKCNGFFEVPSWYFYDHKHNF